MTSTVIEKEISFATKEQFPTNKTQSPAHNFKPSYNINICYQELEDELSDKEPELRSNQRIDKVITKLRSPKSKSIVSHES